MKTETNQIEVVDVRKIYGESNVKAFVNVLVTPGVVINGFTIVKGNHGVFVASPRKAQKDGRWYDVCTFKKEVKAEIEDKVLAAYDKEKEITT